MALISSRQAMPAAPAPFTTTLQSPMFLPAISSALITPASADDGGAVLVVVEDRDIDQLAQALLDDETLGRLDVFQVDAAEGRRDQTHGVDDIVDVLAVDLQVDGVDIGEALKEDRLAFHHRLGAERTQIAQAQNGGAVRDDRHHVAARCVIEGQVLVAGDLQARRATPGE